MFQPVHRRVEMGSEQQRDMAEAAEGTWDWGGTDHR